MRCGDVQKHLAGDAGSADDATARRRAAEIQDHLEACPDCRMAREIYAVIDEELRERPLWQPPPGFAARATRLARVAPGAAPRGQSGANGPPAAVFSGLLVAVLGILVFWRFDAFATGYAECCAAFSGALADNAQQVAWAAAVLSLCLSAWVARRSLRPQD